MNQYWSISMYSWLALVWSQLMNQYWNSIINLLLCFLPVSLFLSNVIFSFPGFPFRISCYKSFCLCIQLLAITRYSLFYRMTLIELEGNTDRAFYNVLQKEFDVSHDQTSVASFEKATIGWGCHFHHIVWRVNTINMINPCGCWPWSP